MLIDPFLPEWQTALNRLHADLPHGAGLMLLIDSAFVPTLSRQLNDKGKAILLFELLPVCSKEARDVSPFVVRFDPADRSLARLLRRCGGWPMLSALATYESIEQVAKRLAAWCIVEVDEQNFNFRFPDTRRLPAIFENLTPQQRWELTGNAVGWHYIGRDGSWCSLPLEPNPISLPVPAKTTLNEHQFGSLLQESEPDEMWVQLLDLGVRTDLLPSQRHALLSNALYVADKHGLDDTLKVAWCLECIETSCTSDAGTLRTRLTAWKTGKCREQE